LAVPYYSRGGITIYHGDCRDILPSLGVIGAILTDPPYPSYLQEEYDYNEETIRRSLERYGCHQFVFWTPSVPFPLPYSGKRIWDKRVGTNTQFEEIYERNRGTGYKIHSHYRHNNSLSASWCGDDSLRHPSQKPIRLMRELVADLSPGLILDPFMGSGTTLRAAKDLGREAVGIEVEERYCEMAAERMRQEVLEFTD